MKFNGTATAEVKTMLAGMVAESAELKSAAGGSVTDAAADWLAPQYLLAAQKKLAGAAEMQHWEILRALVQDLTLLRRGDHSAARLQLDREELDWQRANSEPQKEKEFQEWLKRPNIRKKYFPKHKGGISKRNLRRIERELNLM